MAKIKIVIDTAADMPLELIEKYDFGVLRFMSIFGDKSYATGKDITNAEFYEMLDKSKKIPTTSQTPYMDMYEYLLDAGKNNDTVIYFTISSHASGQNHTANMIVEEIKEENPDLDIRIVDTENFSLHIAQAAICAAELAKEDLDVDEIIKRSLERLNSFKAYLLVDDMKYLEKGGRIKKSTAVVGSLLDIKPILTIKDGLVAFEDKLRGKKKVLDKLIAKMEEDESFDEKRAEFMVIHSDAEAGEELKEKLEENYGEGCVTLVSEFGPIVGTHVGRGAAAVLFGIK